MKKIYLFAGLAAMMVASCSTDEQSTSGYVAGSKVILNASLPNSGTRVNEAGSDTYGLITTWSPDDYLDVLVNTNAVVSMTKSTGNTFTATPGNATIAAGFNAGQTIYGVNNKSNDNITTALNGSKLKATLDFTGQNGTVDNLSKYDLMYGKGDPTGNITFNHKICVLRLVTSLTGLALKYVATSGTKLFASQEVYNFGAACDSTITDADILHLDNTSITVTDGKATVYIAVPNRQNLYGTLTISMKGASTGIPKIYTLTNAISLSNGRMLMSTVHPQAITGLSLSAAANVGDYLFSDGTWGSLENCISTQPVAVIFSKTTSTIDQGHGWTHGYAMALKNALTSCTWGPSGNNLTGTYNTTPAAMRADKDGYTRTKLINTPSYPAAYAVATTYNSIVPAPSNTSGWYLPSIGQWYDICVNLGKMTTTGYTEATGYFTWASPAASSCASNISAYLTPLTSGTYETFTWSSSFHIAYWCSSEYNSTYAQHAGFNKNGNMDVSYSAKTNLWNARGVVAF